jgi:predicted nuclease of restriction endonuclease-like (RecB) superfamily
MSTDLIKDSEYKAWLKDLKSRIRQSQIKAAVRVNSEMIELYWSIGADIVAKQAESVWGSGVIKQLSIDLRSEFPDMQGFSETNIRYFKRFYLFYNQQDAIQHQVGAELSQQLGEKLQIANNKQDIIQYQLGAELENHSIFHIPWRHHVEIINKCKSIDEALFYIQRTIKNGWSRAMLMNFMEVDLYQSQGKSVNNFDRFLPDIQSDLAKETLKDPYKFDFLTLTEGYKEKELEDALVTNITKFLLELGQGFAYIGRQYPIKVGNRERNIDLLFYHLELFKLCESVKGKDSSNRIIFAPSN